LPIIVKLGIFLFPRTNTLPQYLTMPYPIFIGYRKRIAREKHVGNKVTDKGRMPIQKSLILSSWKNPLSPL